MTDHVGKHTVKNAETLHRGNPQPDLSRPTPDFPKYGQGEGKFKPLDADLKYSGRDGKVPNLKWK